MLDQFRNANTGAGQDFTGLTAVVQLRLRVAFGLQTLTVKSRLLTGENTVRIRDNPPFCRFADVAQQRQQQFRKLPGIAPRECESLHRPHFAPVTQIIRVRRFERRGCR